MIDFFVRIIVEAARSMLALVGVIYQRHAPADVEGARAWPHDAFEGHVEHGYPLYGATSKGMRSTRDANPAAKTLLAYIKRAGDSLGLLMPGRHGTLAP